MREKLLYCYTSLISLFLVSTWIISKMAYQPFGSSVETVHIQALLFEKMVF